MIKLLSIKQLLVYCTLINSILSITSDWPNLSCRQKADKVKTTCARSRDRTKCRQGYMKHMVGCSKPHEWLNVPKMKWQELPCEEIAGHIKTSCARPRKRVQCLLSNKYMLEGCENATKLLELSTAKCEERAYRIDVQCVRSRNRQKCQQDRLQELNDCKNGKELLKLKR